MIHVVRLAPAFLLLHPKSWWELLFTAAIKKTDEFSMSPYAATVCANITASVTFPGFLGRGQTLCQLSRDSSTCSTYWRKCKTFSRTDVVLWSFCVRLLEYLMLLNENLCVVLSKSLWECRMWFSKSVCRSSIHSKFPSGCLPRDEPSI